MPARHGRILFLLLASVLAQTRAHALTVSGRVADTQANGIADVEVAFLAGGAPPPVASDTSDALGNYAVDVPAGTYDVRVTPPAGSGFVPQTLPAQEITAPTTLDIILVAASAVTYHGQVVDRNGDPVPDQVVRLCVTPFGGCTASNRTDAQGAFAIQVTPGDYRVEVASDGMHPVPGIPTGYNLTGPTRSLAADTTETLRLENRRLTGTVVDPDGTPVPNVTLSTFFYTPAPFDVFTGGSSSFFAVGDPQGRFEVAVFPGTMSIQVTPPLATGLVGFTVAGVTAVDDKILGILLQFTIESIGGTLPAGGSATTDTEGDGATPSDPVETAVITPNAGDFAISESPVTFVPPGGYRFLTQQINVAAPPATPASPLVLVFRMDASRVPPGEDETTVQIFKDSVLVPGCTGAPGVADPDPCVSARARLGDGDVEITVLTSAASGWNIGVVTTGCGSDAECDDGVACTTDVCDEGTCVHTPQDTACDDGNPCTSGEHCDTASGCVAGSIVPCPDDGNPCTADVCDPGTGLCGIPGAGTCDDGDQCTVDRCEAGGCFFEALPGFAGAACFVTRVGALPLCGDEPVEAKLLEAVAARVAKSLAQLDKAQIATKPGKVVKLVNGAEKSVFRLLEKLAKAVRKGRVSAACAAGLEGRIAVARDVLHALVASLPSG